MNKINVSVKRQILLILICSLSLFGCANTRPALPTAKNVDLNRFMGSWYVIAAIPTFIETKAYKGIETYKLLPNGTIDTVFTFNQGGFNGPFKRFNPRGFVVDKINNSTWKMQFIWPFKAEYLITYLNPDYSQTVIGRNKRDYFWIMARTPTIPDEDYKHLLDTLKSQGYDLAKTRKVPQNHE